MNVETMISMIPFCKTTLGEEEKKAISDVIDSGWVVMGEKTKQFEEEFAKYVGAKYAVFVDSGTSALFLAIKSIAWPVNHPIVVPSLTFASTVEVIIQAGKDIYFDDVNKDDFCLKYPLGQQNDVSQKISNDAKGIYSLPVHLTGNRCKNFAWIYDSAHRIERNDVKDSTSLWCYSFYATKNLTTINGGMIATNDKNASAWLKKARDHGITQGTDERYRQGKWDYDIEFVGWRMKADDVRAALGLVQLKKLDEMNGKRNNIVLRYNELLGLQRTGNHLYPILVEKRAEFIEYMAKNGIQCGVHFIPLHTMTAYKDYPRGDLMNTEYLDEKMVSLPLYPQLHKKEVEYISKKVEESGLMIQE